MHLASAAVNGKVRAGQPRVMHAHAAACCLRSAAQCEEVLAVHFAACLCRQERALPDQQQ